MTSVRAWRALLIDGRVKCPRRDEVVDLALCLGCNWLLDLDRASGTPAVRCAAATPIVDGQLPGPDIRHID